MTLIWVPGHTGIKENELADSIEKMKAVKSIIGPKPYLGMGPCSIKLSINYQVQVKLTEHWKQMKGCCQAKAILITERRMDRVRKIFNLSTEEVRIRVQMLTRHNHLNYYRYKMGIHPITNCKKCDNETSLRVIF